MLKSVLLYLVLLLGYTSEVNAQTDPVGSGRALKFDGVDDYLDMGNTYDDLQLPFTISAWVYIDNSLPGPIFVTQDNDPAIYNGFWFLVSNSVISIEYGDGFGGNNPAYRKGKIAPVSNLQNRWNHICGVMRSATSIDIYVNGINVGGNPSGTSGFPMSSNFPSDITKVGYHISNATVYRFKGLMDEVKFFNRALTETEIREQMCKKLTGNEAGLIGYWNFDETTGNTVFDKSSNKFNGQLKNNPTRVYSGAPIGDQSIFSYKSNWTGEKLTMNENSESVEVSNVTGNPEGVHTYVVRNLPSQTQGLDLTSISDPYFGVFVASTNTVSSFDVTSSTNGAVTCGSFGRTDNSVATWVNANPPMTNVLNRTEIITLRTQSLAVNLGIDEEVCPFVARTLSPVNNPTGCEFTWQDGSKQSTFQAVKYGVYWVKVEKNCLVGVDTIKFTQKVKGELEIDLGEDKVSCSLESKTLRPLSNPSGFEFTWQDGSKQSTFEVNDFGSYWVTVDGECAFGRDTIEISKMKLENLVIPNVFTPGNGDELNQYFQIDQRILGSTLAVYNRWGKQVYLSNDYQNDWDGSGLPVGVYYFRLFGPCLDEKKGQVSIIR